MRRQRGFTLLEIMISLAILGGALVTLLSLSSSDVRASHKAKLLTIAVGLARSKMLDMEEELLRTGFQDTAEDFDGDFDAEGQPKFTWKALVEKVALPEAAKLEEGSKESKPAPAPGEKENDDQLLGLAGGSTSGALGAGMVQMYFPLIRPVLEAAIRKITVEVHWKIGKDEESLKVVSFFTDSKAIDQAMRQSGLGAITAGGGSGTGGTGGSGAPVILK